MVGSLGSAWLGALFGDTYLLSMMQMFSAGSAGGVALVQETGDVGVAQLAQEP